MQLTQTIQQQQTINLLLLQNLTLRMGVFEQQIISNAEFVDGIQEKLEQSGNVENTMYYKILRSLIVRKSEKDISLVGEMALAAGICQGDVQKVIVEHFQMGELGYELGTKRYVVKIKLVLKGGKCMEASVSLDREATTEEEPSPSLEEAETLGDADPEKAWCLQRLLGYKVQPHGKKFLTIIAKEFLRGRMIFALGFTASGMPSQLPKGDRILAQVAYAVGKAVRNALGELGGIPNDSNPMNIIAIHDDSNGVHARWCDAEGLARDKRSIEHEIRLLRESMGPYAQKFDAGMEDDDHQFTFPPLVIDDPDYKENEPEEESDEEWSCEQSDV